MEGKSNAERHGFAPSTYVCPYHIWKPGGVVRGCTCSPTPDHQVKWEREHPEPGRNLSVRRAMMHPGSYGDRGFFNAIDRRSMAILYRSSGETLASALRTARKEIAGRFLRVRDVVRPKQCSETELQKSGGPECRT